MGNKVFTNQSFVVNINMICYIREYVTTEFATNSLKGKKWMEKRGWLGAVHFYYCLAGALSTKVFRKKGLFNKIIYIVFRPGCSW